MHYCVRCDKPVTFDRRAIHGWCPSCEAEEAWGLYSTDEFTIEDEILEDVMAKYRNGRS